MNSNEVSKIVTIVQELYPHYYRNYSESQVKLMYQVWAMALDDLNYSDVSKAVIHYVKSWKSDYPPNPSTLRKIVHDHPYSSRDRTANMLLGNSNTALAIDMDNRKAEMMQALNELTKNEERGNL